MARTLTAWRSLQSILVAVAAALALTAADPVAAADDERVDLELVLAVDVSGSMDRDEQIVQRNGYIEALRHPEVIKAIHSGLIGKVALTYVEWAGPAANRVVVPWHIVDGAASAEAFVERLKAAPLGTMRGTSISAGLARSAELFDDNGITSYRQVIDMSGDGPNNMGAPVLEVRAAVLAKGIVINGLPITLKPGRGYGTIPRLDLYYANCVIGGPGSFLVAVTDRTQLVDAIRRKMVLEIADAGSDYLNLTFGQPARNADYDCLAGEKQRMQWMDP